MKSLINILGFLFFSYSSLTAQEYLPKGDPIKEGMSSIGFTRTSKFLDEMTAEGQVPGSVVIVVRNGKIVFEQASGWADVEKRKPMKMDNLFRMASMTKLITTVGALKLFEEGHFTMDTPLETFLPEFSNPTVFESYNKNSGEVTTYPARNKILMKHVFTHTSGITYPFVVGEGKPFYDKAKITQAFPNPAKNVKVSEELSKLAQLPLSHEPGEGWTYGMNMDILGRVIEIISGKSYAQFIQDEVFNPLKMTRSFFALPRDEWKNLATPYTFYGGKMKIYGDNDIMLNFSSDSRTSMEYYKGKGEKDRVFGGTDLISCAQDYARFLQMIMNYGELDNERILSKKTIEMLETPLFKVISDHKVALKIDPEVHAGLSVRVIQDKIAKFQLISTGSYFWGGYFNTQFWMDRKENLFYLVMMQYAPDPTFQNNRLKHLIWGSIVR